MSLILFLSCTSSELTQRESIEWVELAHNGDLLSVRWVKSNTGLLKNQAHVRLNYFKAEQNPIEYSFHAPESEHIWAPNDIKIGPHELQKKEDLWTMQLHDDELNLRIENDSSGTSPCQFETKDWAVEIISLQAKDQGWLQSQKRSLSLQGDSFIIKHQGSKRALAPHRWLLLQASSLQLFYEDWNDFQYGCIRKNDQLIALSKDAVEWSDDGARIKTPELVLNITWRKELGAEDPYLHLLSGERWIAESSFPLNKVHWIQGYAQEESSAGFYPVIFRYQGSTPPKIKQRKTKPTFPNPPKSDSLKTQKE